MKVRIHRLFEYLLETAGEDPPECVVGFSLSQSPKLGAFLPDLSPDLALDWNGISFQGLPALRDRVIAQAGLQGLCDASDVLITAGAAEANYLCFRQLLEPGDHVVTETPGWPQAAVMAQAIGADLALVKRHEGNGWRLDLEALAAAVTPKTKLIFLSNPNNPTGQLLTTAELHQIAAIADGVGAWLIVDEVYAGLEWQGPRAPSIAGIYPRGITTGSVSKALGLQGLRTGWLICRDKAMVMDAVILRENSSEIMNILGEHIAEIALRPERLAPALAQARADGMATLAQLDAFIAGQSRLSWVKPQAGLIGLARLQGEDAEPFARRLLAAPYRTFVLPGTAYAEPAHIRLGVGGGAAVRLEEGLRRLAACLATNPKKTTPGQGGQGGLHVANGRDRKGEPKPPCRIPLQPENPMQTIVKLPPTSASAPSTDILDGWVVTEGNPQMKTWGLHTSAAGDMVCGIWECTEGSFHATYTAYEYVVLIEGRIVITPDGGTPVTVQAPDSFVVEPTFKGTWKIEQAVRKHFDFRIK